MIPGGFSGGDEPDGTGKFIASIFEDPGVQEELWKFLEVKKGLILGICNGFQGLVKMGLLPEGRFQKRESQHPILGLNSIGRHQSRLVRTRISSLHSPWMDGMNLGDIHTLPVSHGEGRFVISEDQLKVLDKNGQIATQYVDFEGNPTMNVEGNPNGSYWGIEGVFSPDGLVFGKMAHSERVSQGVYLNVEGDFQQRIFDAGIRYYR
jgi:phosphoribosylformylglycinamidine synthase